MKIRVKKANFWQLGRAPYLELVMEENDYSNVVLQLDGNNEMNRKLAEKIKSVWKRMLI